MYRIITKHLEKIANECDVGEHTNIAREALELIYLNNLDHVEDKLRDRLFDARKTIAIASAAVDSFGIGSIDQEQLVKMLYTSRDILSKLLAEIDNPSCYWHCSACGHEWPKITPDEKKNTCPKCGYFVIGG